MNLKLKEKIKESLSAVLPITGIVLMLSIFLVPMELGSIVMFLTGAVMLIVGMGFFQLGAEMAMTPIGEGVGVQISKMKKLITVLLTGSAGPCRSGALRSQCRADYDGSNRRRLVSCAGNRPYPL